MGKRREKGSRSSQTLPSSPSHSFSSSSSSDFEFTISISPRQSSAALCPADELFYKGQLLPLHLSPRISMVRTLLLASSSAASSSSDTSASRDSTGSSSSNESTSSFASDRVLLGGTECDSSRPSSVTEDDEFKRLNCHQGSHVHFNTQIKKSSKYFSLPRFSSVFKKEPKSNREDDGVSGSSSSSSVRKMSSTAREVIGKYLKKVRPLYEKLSQKHQQKIGGAQAIFPQKPERSVLKDSEVTSVQKNVRKESNGGFSSISNSFSGNLRYPRRRSCISSCPSSMRSSPSHSGVLSNNGLMGYGTSRVHGGGMYYADTSSMEELQSAIQGAIAHCKNSLMQNKTTITSKET